MPPEQTALNEETRGCQDSRDRKDLAVGWIHFQKAGSPQVAKESPPDSSGPQDSAESGKKNRETVGDRYRGTRP